MQDTESETDRYGTARRAKELSVSGQFYRMRDDWCRFVMDRSKGDLTPVEKLVGVKIALTIDPKQRGYKISQARIARDLGIAEQTVKNAVAKLKKMGLLESERIPEQGTQKTFNRYSLVAVQDAVPIE